MKRKFWLISILAIVLFGCSSGIEPGSDKTKESEESTGMGFILKLPDSSNSRATYYSQNDASLYKVKLSKGQQQLEEKNGLPGQELRFAVSEEDSYTFEIKAYDSSNNCIAEGKKTVSITSKDGYVSVSITLDPKLKSIDIIVQTNWNTPILASEGIYIDNVLLSKTSEIYVIPVNSGNVKIPKQTLTSVFYKNREVILSPYTLGQYEVTQELFDAVMGENPSSKNSETYKYYPVDSANWYQVIAFCNKLSIKNGLSPVYSVEGISDWENLEFNNIPQNENSNWNSASIDITKNGYRLPTEAEWEYAARGGNPCSEEWNYSYSGNNIANTVSWTSEISSYESHEVGTKAPNSLGLYDMCGNQWEWCNDLYANIDYETQSSSINPMNTTVGVFRTQRGGSWKDPSSLSLISNRRSDACGGGPSAHWVDWGFRLCRSLTALGSTDNTSYSNQSGYYSSNPLPIPNGLTSLPTENADIGKILCSDGALLTVTDFVNSNKQAVAVVCGYDKNGTKLGLGLIQSSPVKWCGNDDSSFVVKDPLCENIVASFFRSTKSQNESSIVYNDLGFDGDLEGYDNWNQICSVDASAVTNMQTDYPLFYFANTYGTAASLQETSYADDWFIPTIYELYQIYKNKTLINEALSACNGTLLTNTRYWTSSEWKYNSERTFDDLHMGSAWNIDFSQGHINPEWIGKACEYITCVIRKL